MGIPALLGLKQFEVFKRSIHLFLCLADLIDFDALITKMVYKKLEYARKFCRALEGVSDFSVQTHTLLLNPWGSIIEGKREIYRDVYLFEIGRS